MSAMSDYQSWMASLASQPVKKPSRVAKKSTPIRLSRDHVKVLKAYGEDAPNWPEADGVPLGYNVLSFLPVVEKRLVKELKALGLVTLDYDGYDTMIKFTKAGKLELSKLGVQL